MTLEVKAESLYDTEAAVDVRDSGLLTEKFIFR